MKTFVLVCVGNVSGFIGWLLFSRQPGEMVAYAAYGTATVAIYYTAIVDGRVQESKHQSVALDNTSPAPSGERSHRYPPQDWGVD
jgi:hypothetical protein